MMWFVGESCGGVGNWSQIELSEYSAMTGRTFVTKIMRCGMRRLTMDRILVVNIWSPRRRTLSQLTKVWECELVEGRACARSGTSQ